MRMTSLLQCACPIIVAAAAVGAALLWPALLRICRLPQTLVSSDSKDPDALRIGILGASFIARAAVVNAADKRKDVRVSAVAARDAQRAETYAAKHGIPAFHGGSSAYSELLAREDVDAVYIGLPTGLHLEWSLAALRAGKDVLLEKPAVLNAQEASELVQEAERTRRKVIEAAHYRYHPAAKRAKQLMSLTVADGGISPLRFVEVRFSMLDPKAWLRSMKFWPGADPMQERILERERVKNFDRWWYCVDMLLWSTDALDARVISATEKRFSLTALLELRLSKSLVINASMSMARDSLLDPFTWSLSAAGQNSASSLTLHNFGFPFLWHRLDLTRLGVTQSEQLYGLGETTFEHQLGTFRETLRSGEYEDTMLLTMRTVDRILELGGLGAFPSNGAGPT
ncbi:unnamed protein product [Symbiodinium sp. CCMP2456]|nr:unnamed protein product [Symbiodinium sp. CCMP2456]